MTCKTEGSRNTVYLGETARTMFDRGEEHLRAMNNMNEESPMVEPAHDVQNEASNVSKDSPLAPSK